MTKDQVTKWTEAVESALVTLGEELINYDQRMIKAKAPNIRFTHEYNAEALASIQTSTAQMLEGLIGENESLQMAASEITEYHNETLRRSARNALRTELSRAIQKLTKGTQNE